MPRSKRSFASGFTLVETLIAISILVMAVTGAFAAAQNGISSAVFSKDQIAAFYLAQEAVEHIRNMRDQNGLSGAPWLTGLSLGQTYRVDAVNDEIEPCSGNSCTVKLSEEGFYNHETGTDTNFRREVSLEEIVPNQEVAITVVVTWSKGVVQRTFTARENIFNWQ